MKPFYITTPIYYVNDRPHIGHAYSTIAADVLARYQRLRGRPTRFLTGTDEHGQKIERRAKEKGIEPQAFVDSMAPPFMEAFNELRCEYDDFIRTTEARHEERVGRIWKKLIDAGDIYLGEYEGWYSVSSEAYLTEKELLPGNLDPITRKPVERVREKSYFFRLSAYADRLMKFYETNPTFVQPEGRFNEVKSFVSGGLRDLSISRTSFRWGVPVPDDPEHVMYVWLDALTNYISALGGPAETGEAELFDRFWPDSGDAVHIVGKDILRFHAVYWPAFLMSAGIAPPTQVWAHGWLTVDGIKMSKSLGNFIPPGPLVEELGADPVRYYLMREVAFGQDGDFSHENLFARYHGDLGNGLGNLLNRMVSSIVKRNLGGKVPAVAEDRLSERERTLIETARRSATTCANHLDAIAPHRALEAAWELVAAANKYVDQTAPWNLAKNNQTAELEVVAYTVLESLRWLGIMLWPFMPDKCDALRGQLGLPPVAPIEEQDGWPSEWGALPGGTETAPGHALFPRFDKTQMAAIFERLGVGAEDKGASSNAENQKGETGKGETGKGETPQKGAGDSKKASSSTKDGTIAFDDFMKVDLRLGTVLSAEPVKKSDRLLKLEIDLGEATPRQVLAGIRAHYDPATLVGKQVVVVANLKPRKIMGLESQGMVLAASDDSGLSVLGVDKSITTGTRVS
ncbi:MAG: methionine--tRNA ligase [Myxococcota bacterium]